MIRRAHSVLALLAVLLPAAAAHAQYGGFPYVRQPLPLHPHERQAQTAEARAALDDKPRAKRRGDRRGKGRVIHAEAEVTIFGPDRMIIRLYRKKSRASARSVRAD